MIRGLVVPGPQAMKAGGDECLGIGIRQFIAGDLLANEAVEGLSALNDRMT